MNKKWLNGMILTGVCLIIFVLLSLYVNSVNSIKIDKDKSLVYDASYDDRGLSPSITKAYGVFYLSDVKVPYINIDSTDAHIVNNELKEVYNSLLDTYEKSSKDSYTFIEYCDYKYDKGINTLDIFFSYGISTKDVSIPLEYMYSFDLSTGKLIKKLNK